MRAGELVDGYRNARQVARRLQTIIEAQDRLRNHCRTERRDASAAPAAFETVDARPFADIVTVSRAALEKFLLEPAQHLSFGQGLFAVVIPGGHPHIETGPFKKAFLDRHQNGKVKDRVVRRNFNGWPDRL